VNIDDSQIDFVAPLNDQIPFGMNDFAAISMEAMYVIDFSKRGFYFVANNPLFLCGHTVEQVLSLGYNFFSKVIHPDDLLLLMEALDVIRQRMSDMNDLGALDYFSFTVRMKHQSRHMMIYHKLRPVFVNKRLQFGLCLLSSSVLNKSGCLCAHYTDGVDYEEFVLESKEWIKRRIPMLSEQEKGVLRLVHRGKIGMEAANKLCISYHAYQSRKRAIFKKLKTNSITESVIYAFNHRLIFDYPNHPKQKKNTEPKKQRRPMTPEKLLRVQDELNKGCSVNSIAIREGVGEWTIRYAIRTGKLTE